MSEEHNGVGVSNFHCSIFNFHFHLLATASAGVSQEFATETFWPLSSVVAFVFQNISFINGSKFNNPLEVRRTFNFQ
jgi:hypothetical protein